MQEFRGGGGGGGGGGGSNGRCFRAWVSTCLVASYMLLSRTADADALNTPQKAAWIALRRRGGGWGCGLDVDGARTKREWFRYEVAWLGLGAGKCRCDGGVQTRVLLGKRETDM